MQRERMRVRVREGDRKNERKKEMWKITNNGTQ